MMQITFTRDPEGNVTYRTDDGFDKGEYGVQAEFLADCHAMLTGIDQNLWKADFEAGDDTTHAAPSSDGPATTR